jgi:GTPase SAR1 family protein
MVFFNHATRQMTAKIVYYGPGLCGKTTNLSAIYERTSQKARGEMVSLNTETDRTLFFDLLPLEVGVIGGFKAKLQLYTVPGQVFYNSTRKLVLKGVDGIVFVADSQTAMLDANRESIQNLAENLRELGLNLADIPMVFQWNKRDLKQILAVEVLERELNAGRLVSFSAIARSGEGVFETLRGISRLALAQIKRQHLGDAQQAPLPPPEVPAWSRATPPIVPIVPDPAPPWSGLAPLPIAGSLGSDTQPGLRAFPKADGQARAVPGRDQTLPEALSFLDALPPEPPPSTALPEALSFLDLASGPELFERMWEESELPSVAAPVSESTPADGQVKVMTPLVVKLLPPQPTRPPAPMNFGTTSGSGLAPKVNLKPPSAQAPRVPAPARAVAPIPIVRPVPVLKVALPPDAAGGELEIQVRVLRNGAVVAQSRAAIPGPGPEGSSLSIEFKRS